MKITQGNTFTSFPAIRRNENDHSFGEYGLVLAGLLVYPRREEKKSGFICKPKKILWQLPHLPFIPHYPRKIHPTGGEMLYWMHKINFHLHLECSEGSDSIRESNNERMSFGHGTVFPWQGNRLPMVNVKAICLGSGEISLG